MSRTKGKYCHTRVLLVSLRLFGADMSCVYSLIIYFRTLADVADPAQLAMNNTVVVKSCAQRHTVKSVKCVCSREILAFLAAHLLYANGVCSCRAAGLNEKPLAGDQRY